MARFFNSIICPVVNVLHAIDVVVCECEVFPFALVFETVEVIWCKLHLGEFLREMLGAVFVV